jgi:hypothetical protein
MKKSFRITAISIFLALLIISWNCKNKNINNFISTTDNETITFDIDKLDSITLKTVKPIDRIFVNKYLSHNSTVNGWQEHYQLNHERFDYKKLDSLEKDYINSQNKISSYYFIPYSFKPKNCKWYLILKKIKQSELENKVILLYLIVIQNNVLQSTVILGTMVKLYDLGSYYEKTSSRIINYKLIQRITSIQYSGDLIMNDKITCHYDTLTEYFKIKDTLSIDILPYRSIQVRDREDE